MARKNKNIKIKGIKKVIDNINKELKKIEGDVSSKGFIRVAMLVYQYMENNSPKIPVDTGNLRSSYFATIKGKEGAHNIGKGSSGNTKSSKDKMFQETVVSLARTVAQQHPYPNMIFGFSANYSKIVHENLNPSVHWQREGAGPKFFERALQANEYNILDILKNNIKL